MKSAYTIKDLTSSNRQTIQILLSRGMKTTDIIVFAEQSLNIIITVQLVAEIKRTDIDIIKRLKREIKLATKVEADDILQLTRSLLTKKLNRAMKNMDKLDVLDTELSEGVITKDEYNIKNAGIPDISITELMKLADSVAPKIQDIPSALLPTATAQTTMSPELKQRYTQALIRGDAIELQSILFTPQEALPATT